MSTAGTQLRKCYRCGESKPIGDLSWRRKAIGQRDSLCRPCRSAYGKEHYAVLEFDHLRDKLFDIGQALPYRNWQSILDEIAKCDVVCANCHRRRTAGRKGSLRATLAQPTDFVLQAGDRN